MAKNKVSEGRTFDYVAAGAEVSGGIKIFDAMCGINLTTAASGQKCVAAVEGAWEVPKATGDAFAQGAKLGAVSATGGGRAVVATASGAKPLGNCAVAVAAGTSAVVVRLNSW